MIGRLISRPKSRTSTLLSVLNRNGYIAIKMAARVQNGIRYPPIEYSKAPNRGPNNIPNPTPASKIPI